MFSFICGRPRSSVVFTLPSFPVFSVHNVLGPGLLESAYEGALVIELKRRGLRFERQQVFPLYYKGELAGAHCTVGRFPDVSNEIVSQSLEFFLNLADK